MLKGLFDKRLLELMYFLSTQPKLLNSKEIAESFRLNGKPLTDRSVRRYLSFLKKQQYFWYYPNIKYESLGLMTVFVVINGLKDNSILNIIPSVVSTNIGTNLNNFQKCAVLTYAIPPENFNDFAKFWETAKEYGLISSFFLQKFTLPVVLYSPVHKIVSEDGSLDLKLYQPDNNQNINLLEKRLGSKSIPKVHEAVIKNPFIVHIVLEYFRDYSSSQKVWYNIKKKVGEDKIWGHLRKIKKKIRKSDSSGIKFVQESTKYLHDYFEHFFGQVRVYYDPLLYKNCELFCLVVKVKDGKNLVNFISEVSRHSLSTTVCPTFEANSKIAILFIQTTSKSISRILSDLVPKYADPSFKGILSFVDVEDTLKYWGNFKHREGVGLKWNYHNLFDIHEVKWKFESSTYMGELEKLSKKMGDQYESESTSSKNQKNVALINTAR